MTSNGQLLNEKAFDQRMEQQRAILKEKYHYDLTQDLYRKMRIDDKLFVTENEEVFKEIALLNQDELQYHTSPRQMTQKDKENFDKNFRTYLTSTVKNKVIAYKNGLFNAAQQEYNTIEQELKGMLPPEQRAYLQRRSVILKERMFGKDGTSGLRGEITKLRNDEFSVQTLGMIFQNDLLRLNEIVNRVNNKGEKEIHLEDIEQAERIIDFFDAVTDYSSTQSGKRLINPVFDPAKFQANPDATAQAIVRMLTEFKSEYADARVALEIGKNNAIAKAALGTIPGQNLALKLKRDAAEAFGSSEGSIDSLVHDYTAIYKALFPDELSDIDLYSKLFLDPTLDMTGTDYAAQLAVSIIQEEDAKQRAISAEERNDLASVAKTVEELAKKLGTTINDMFMRKTKDGLFDGSLKLRHSREYYAEMRKIKATLQRRLTDARSIEDPDVRKATIKDAIIRYKKRLGAANHLVSVSSLISAEDIAEEYREYMPEGYQRDESAYNALVERYGQHHVDELVEEQKKKLESYFAECEQIKVDSKNEIKRIDAEINELKAKEKFDAATVEEREKNQDIRDNIKELKERQKSLEGALKDFQHRSNPFAINDGYLMNNDTGHEIMFNVLVPKQDNELNLVDGTISYYEKGFDTIDQYDEAYQYWKIATQIATRAKESNITSYALDDESLQIISVDKTLWENIKDISRNPEYALWSRVGLIIRELIEAAAKLFNEQRGRIESIAELDPITGQYVPKVNNGWYKTYEREIRDELRLFNASLDAALGKLGDDVNNNIIYERTIMDVLTKFFPHKSVEELQNMLNRYYDPNTGDFDVKTMVHNMLANDLVISTSQDLTRNLNVMSMSAAQQRARQKVLPMIKIIRDRYHTIRKAVTNNRGRRVFSKNKDNAVTDNFRTSAVARFDDWYNNVVLGIRKSDYVALTDKNIEAFKTSKQRQVELLQDCDEILKAEGTEAEKYTQYEAYDPDEADKNRRNYIIDLVLKPGKRTIENVIFTDTRHLKKRIGVAIKEVSEMYQKLLSERDAMLGDRSEMDVINDESFDHAAFDALNEEIAYYEKSLRSMIDQYDGAHMEASLRAFISSIKTYIRFNGLAWNLFSSINNYLQGHMANSLLATTEQYFTRDSYAKSRKFLAASMVNKLTFGKFKTNGTKKIESLMNKFDIVQDSSDIFERSSRSQYDIKSKLKVWNNAFSFTQHVEYLNQNPIMISILYDTKIYDKDGNESNLFDAYDSEGHLLEEFRTEENIAKFDSPGSDVLANLQERMTNAIIAGHGDYSSIHGSMATRDMWLSFLTMFKRWMGTYVYNQFHKETYHIASGTTTKGRKLSHTWGNMAGAMTFMALMTGSPFGIVLPIALSLPIAKMIMHERGVNTNYSQVREFLNGLLGTAAATISIPVNLVSTITTGKRVGGIFDISNFTRGYAEAGNIVDAKNMEANYKEYATIVLAMLIFMLCKMKFEDHKDDDDPTYRALWAIAGNISGSFGLDIVAMSSPVSIAVNYNQVPFFSYIDKFVKGFATINDAWMTGEDVYLTGPNAGKNKYEVQFLKMFAPAFFKPGAGYLGFASPSQDIYADPGALWNDSFLFNAPAENALQAVKEEKAVMRRKAKDGKLDGLNGEGLTGEDLKLWNEFLDSVYTQKSKTVKSRGKNRSGKQDSTKIKEDPQTMLDRIEDYDESNIVGRFNQWKAQKAAKKSGRGKPHKVNRR